MCKCSQSRGLPLRCSPCPVPHTDGLATCEPNGFEQLMIVMVHETCQSVVPCDLWGLIVARNAYMRHCDTYVKVRWSPNSSAQLNSFHHSPNM